MDDVLMCSIFQHYHQPFVLCGFQQRKELSESQVVRLLAEEPVMLLACFLSRFHSKGFVQHYIRSDQTKQPTRARLVCLAKWSFLELLFRFIPLHHLLFQFCFSLLRKLPFKPTHMGKKSTEKPPINLPSIFRPRSNIAFCFFVSYIFHFVFFGQPSRLCLRNEFSII